jgi:hypothetical protein
MKAVYVRYWKSEFEKYNEKYHIKLIHGPV